MLKDELNQIKQTNFMVNRIEDHVLEYYKRKITKKLISLRKRGETDYTLNVPCFIYKRLGKYFASEGMWVIYLHSNDNRICRVTVCPEITKEDLDNIKAINKIKYGK